VMNIIDVVKAAVPDASKEFVEWLLWSRTPYPVGGVTARSLYKTASRWKRATTNKRNMCELCDNLAIHGTLCKTCHNAMYSNDKGVE